MWPGPAVKAELSIPPEYRFDPRTGRYRNEKGRFVSPRIVYALRDLNEAASVETMQRLSLALAEGRLSAPAWYLSMQHQLRRLHVQNAALGAGGFDRLVAQDFTRIDRLLQEEMDRLLRFGSQIQAGLLSDPQILNRINMYAGTARRQFYDARYKPKARKNQIVIERRILRPAEHCSLCVYLADLGWQPYGILPPPGASVPEWHDDQCLSNCRCDMETRVVGKKKGERMIAATRRPYWKSVPRSFFLIPSIPTGIEEAGKAWDESAHPRHPEGTPVDPATGEGGGRFAPKDGSAVPANRRDPGPVDIVAGMVGEGSADSGPISPSATWQEATIAYRQEKVTLDDVIQWVAYISNHPGEHNPGDAFIGMDALDDLVERFGATSPLEFADALENAGVNLEGLSVQSRLYIMRNVPRGDAEGNVDAFIRTAERYAGMDGLNAVDWENMLYMYEVDADAVIAATAGQWPNTVRAAIAIQHGDTDRETFDLLDEPAGVKMRSAKWLETYATGRLGLEYVASEGALQSAEESARRTVQGEIPERADREERAERVLLYTTDRVADIVETRPIAIRVESTDVPALVADGRWKTQFETGDSNGMYDPHTRAKVENIIMGVPKDIDKAKRPVYAYVDLGVAGTENEYGAIKFVLKDGVKGRATITVGDSLAAGNREQVAAVPVPLLRNTTAHLGEKAWVAFQSLGTDNRRLATQIGYIEAQIHGGLTLEDVAYAVYDPSAHRKQPHGGINNAVAALQAAGIEVRSEFFDDPAGFFKAWDESAHPRHPAGTPVDPATGEGGGRFAPKDGSASMAGDTQSGEGSADSGGLPAEVPDDLQSMIRNLQVSEDGGASLIDALESFGVKTLSDVVTVFRATPGGRNYPSASFDNYSPGAFAQELVKRFGANSTYGDLVAFTGFTDVWSYIRFTVEETGLFQSMMGGKSFGEVLEDVTAKTGLSLNHLRELDIEAMIENVATLSDEDIELLWLNRPRSSYNALRKREEDYARWESAEDRIIAKSVDSVTGEPVDTSGKTWDTAGGGADYFRFFMENEYPGQGTKDAHRRIATIVQAEPHDDPFGDGLDGITGQVSFFDDAWTSSSNGPAGSEIQHEVSKMLGVTPSEWQRHRLEEAEKRIAEKGYNSDFSSRPTIPLMPQIAKAYYDNTQAELQRAGVKEVRLFRGVALSPDQSAALKRGDVMQYDDNVLSSWTPNLGDAFEFATGISQMFAGQFDSDFAAGAIISTVVPAERIFGTYYNGIGYEYAKEFVVIGDGKPAHAMVHAIYPEKPEDPDLPPFKAWDESAHPAGTTDTQDSTK